MGTLRNKSSPLTSFFFSVAVCTLKHRRESIKVVCAVKIRKLENYNAVLYLYIFFCVSVGVSATVQQVQLSLKSATARMNTSSGAQAEITQQFKADDTFSGLKPAPR